MKKIILTALVLTGSSIFSQAHASSLDCGSDGAVSVNISVAEGVRIDSPGAIFSITVTNMLDHSYRAQTNVVESRENLLVLNFSTVTAQNKIDDRSIFARLQLPVVTNDKGVRQASGPGRVLITRFPGTPIRFMRGSYALLSCQGSI